MENDIPYTFDLRFKNPDHEKGYQQESIQDTLRVFEFFFYYMVIAFAVTMTKCLIFNGLLSIVRTLMMAFLFAFLFKHLKKYCQKNKFMLDFSFCLLLLTLYVVHIKFFIPSILEQLSKKVVLHLALGLEAFRVFFFISRINWILVFFTNLIMNCFNCSLIRNENLNESVICSLFSFIMGSALPLLFYFRERSLRLMFYQHLCSNSNLKSFEEMINKILPNLILIIDPAQSKLLFCNEAVSQFFKTSNYDEILQNLDRFALGTSNIASLVQEINNKDDETFIFSDFHGSFFSPETQNETFFDVKMGKIHWKSRKAMIVLLTDISAMKMTKKLVELDQYKDKLLATVSHDLRTPLNGMVGILELLSNRLENKESKKYVKIAKRCVNLLLFMINDILDFSQMHHGKLRLIFSKFRVIDMTKEVIDMIKFQCRRKNLEFILDFPKGLINQYMISDYRRVQQVLLNLLSNSLKFTTNGYIKLSIRKEEENDRRYVSFTVEDSGMGIRKEDSSKLFQLFGKLNHKDPSKNPSGVGLGLVISQNMVRMLSSNSYAKIDFMSEYEKGSVFSFKLPLAIPEEEDINEEFQHNDKLIKKLLGSYNSNCFSPNLRNLENSHCSSSRKTTGKYKISALLVDDDQINLFVIGKYLESFGIVYQTASNGKIALEKLQSHVQIDILITDCLMPVMSGYETALMIRELSKSGRIDKFPILALTASTNSKDLDEIKESGMDEYLVKPVGKKQIREKLQDMLKIEIHEFF